MWAGVIRLGLPSTTSKPTFISGIVAQRPHEGVADEVREGDLAAAGAGEVVVDDGAVVPQELDGHRAHRRGGRHGQRGVHVGRGARRGAAQDRVGRLVAGLGLARRAWGPSPRACSCPWRAPRRPQRGAARTSGRAPWRVLRPGPSRRPSPGAFSAGPWRRGALAGAAAGAFSCALAGACSSVLAPLPKYVAHSGPTLAGSLSYCSFISSTSHSLAPRSEDGATEDWLPDCPFGDCATLVSPLSELFAQRMDNGA